MISLSNARSLVEEIVDGISPMVYSELTLRDWARKGVISHLKVEDGKALYPDIITSEILTVLKLKRKYKISEIAKARKCLEFDGGDINQITEKDIMRFINTSKLFLDKKLVTKLSINQIESLDKIKKLIDDLVREKDHLEVLEDYLKEFIKADKEIKIHQEKKEEIKETVYSF